jgi:hypothetical protein
MVASLHAETRVHFGQTKPTGKNYRDDSLFGWKLRFRRGVLRSDPCVTMRFLSRQ